jgi:hypothetical protein
VENAWNEVFFFVFVRDGWGGTSLKEGREHKKIYCSCKR